MDGRVEDGGKAGFHDRLVVGAVPLRAQPLRACPAGVCRGFDYSILSGDGTFPVHLVYGQFLRLPLDLRRICRRAVFPALGGAVLTSSLSYWQGEAFRRGFDSRGRFDDVLKILLLLDAAQKEGRTLSVQEFRRHINMGYDELGELLEKLARYGYIYSGRQGWVLKTGADSIELSELFKLFVYRPLPVERDHVNQAVDAVMTPCLQTLNMTLAEFDAQAKKRQ